LYLTFDAAFEAAEEIKKIFLNQTGMPTVVVDVAPVVFETMIKNTVWLTDDDAWKALCGLFPPQHASYPQSIRDAISNKRSEGYRYILLFSMREERMQLLHLF
jgi:translation initiation factor 2-alpha kinase 4